MKNPQARHNETLRQVENYRALGRDPERLRRHVTDGLIGHLEHHPRWPVDERAQHLIRQSAADLLVRRRSLYRRAVRAWYHLGAPPKALRDAAARLIEQGRRHAARLAARETHQTEGLPHFITGIYSPSGCAECGRDRHHHNPVGSDLFARHDFREPGQDSILLAMRQRRHHRAEWFLTHRYDRCAICHVARDRHPAEHRVTAHFFAPEYEETDDAQHITGPFTPLSRKAVLAAVVRDRSHRWEHLYPENWGDEGAEVEMDAIRAEGMYDDLNAWKFEDDEAAT